MLALTASRHAVLAGSVIAVMLARHRSSATAISLKL